MPIITPLDFKEEIRKFREEAPKLPPINQRNGNENFYTLENDFHGEALTLPDISTAGKRRIRSRRKAKKIAKSKKHPDKESSTEIKKVKKRKPPPIRKIPGEITRSFLVVSSAGGSSYSLIQRRSSSASDENCDRQEVDL